MRKPSWKDSPPWAKYLAQDRDQQWYWYELEPVYNEHGGFWSTDCTPYSPGQGRWEDAAFPELPQCKWTETLESKPKE